MPVKLFFSYAHEDELVLNQLKKHLIPLQRQGLIEMWHDRDISAGTVWEQEISKRMDEAQIILLLISPDFIASDYCYGIEMMQALQKHAVGTARVIPIIVRPVDIQGTPFAHLQFLPRDAVPVTSWRKRDEAFLDIAKGIRTVLNSYSDPVSTSIHVESTHQPVPLKRTKIPVRTKIVAAVLAVAFLIASASGIYLVVRQNTGNLLIKTSTFTPANNATPVFNDPLLESNHHNDWFQSEDCRFADDGFHVTTSLQNYIDFCYVESTNFHNFIYEVQMKIVRGMEGGIVYRLDSNSTNLYYFGINRDGDYEIAIIKDHGQHSDARP